MEGVVYALCGLTALACGVLLFRGYRRSKIRLLLWSALFFLTLAAENGILFIDLRVMPLVDLSLIRNSIALTGTCVLIYGLIWDSK